MRFLFLVVVCREKAGRGEGGTQGAGSVALVMRTGTGARGRGRGRRWAGLGARVAGGQHPGGAATQEGKAHGLQ
jgi:hypothetical protein